MLGWGIIRFFKFGSWSTSVPIFMLVPQFVQFSEFYSSIGFLFSVSQLSDAFVKEAVFKQLVTLTLK